MSVRTGGSAGTVPRDRPELRAKRNPARYRLVMVGAGVIGRVGAGAGVIGRAGVRRIYFLHM